MNFARLATGFVGFAVLVLCGSAAVPRQQPAPQPAKLKIAVRYHIPSPRDEHVVRYKAMVDHLDKIGFEFDPKLKPFPNTDYEDRGKNVLTGFIASDKALQCLANQSVASILLMPPDYKIPEEPGQPVRVRLELAGGLPEARQLVLANQVKVLLAQLYFKESVGYDDRGYSGKPHTRIVGQIPADQLLTLLKDLRTQPSGWLEPLIDPLTLPSPVSQRPPIIVTEVVPEPSPALEIPPPAKRGQDYLDKITPELWSMVVSKEDDTKIVRAEIILSYVPAPGDESYRTALLREAPSLLIEGRLGPVVTGLLRVNQSGGLAGLSQVSVIRLARTAMVQINPAISFAGDNAKALKQTGLEQLHQRNLKGQGARIAIVDSDFRAYEKLINDGKLPKTTRLVDLTTAFNFDLYPDPQLQDDKVIGHGTHCALAAALAAPEAELTLIRIDPASLLQLQFVAKVINGDLPWDDHIARRLDELKGTAQALAARRDEVARDRNAILDNFDDDSELKRKYELLGPAVRGWLFTPREWLYLRLAELERDRARYDQLETRFQKFYTSLKELKGIQIVCTSLVWNDGYPLGGGSPLSKWFEDTPGRKALWFVSAGNTRGQSWTGPFRDANADGVMEFAPPSHKLPPETWTPELNFLGWQPHEADGSLDLPEGAKIRITAQWQEPHDPSYFWNPVERDYYLKPLADLSLIVLRQRDPSGKILPADDCEVVARSPVPAFRIENHPSGSVYEQVVEFTVIKAGRYALRVERQLPSRWELALDPATDRPILVEKQNLAATGIRPLDVPNLPALETQWECRPRIFVGVIDPVMSAKGRVVFRDFWTTDGSIPILADTRSLIAVGAANFDDKPRPYSASGTPGTLWNFVKPNVLTYDGLALTPPGSGSAYGTSLATPFAAGTAATLLAAGQRPQLLEAQLQKMCNVLFRLAK
ncbi:MAG TPA: hypothetical protein VE988_28290 [Gemmataceae bacterium]|nr:hypothetical protein [Gemmataceae bacterium]